MSETKPLKVALVTGAGSGIGKACALALNAAGWTVVLSGRRLAPLQAVIGEMSCAERARAALCDVSDESSVQALFEDIVRYFGRLDLLFNNAGVFTAGVPLEDLPVAAWRAAAQLRGLYRHQACDVWPHQGRCFRWPGL